MKKTLHLLLASTAAASVLSFAWLGTATADAPHPEFMAAPAKIPAKAEVEVIDAHGPLYDIAEENLLEAFFREVAKMKSSGEYQRRFDEEKQKIRSRMETPPAVELPAASEIRRWAIEPSIPESLPEQLLMEARNVELPRLSRPLIFIDGEAEESRVLLKKIPQMLPDARIVLTGGSVAKASRASGSRIFFDQGGALVRRFGIEAVPAALFNGDDGAEGIEFPVSESSTVFSHIQGTL